MRVWRPDWPCPVGRILAPLRHGSGDPTYAVVDGAHVRAMHTPGGPATLSIAPLNQAGEVVATAWGDGAEWALGQVPRMLGADDDPTGFEPPDVLRQASRLHQHWRVGASGLVMESLVPAIIEQKVTGKEAFASYRRLVQTYGAPAPGPVPTLRLPPTPLQLREIPSWEWLKLGVDSARSRPIQHAVRVADSLERAGRQEPEEFERRVRSLPGIGRWTAAEVRARALGDADAVSFGDYHIAKNVTYALTGEVGDDDLMEELLEPYRPHRGRVVALVHFAGLGRERRGPRFSLPTHLPGKNPQRG